MLLCLPMGRRDPGSRSQWAVNWSGEQRKREVSYQGEQEASVKCCSR